MGKVNIYPSIVSWGKNAAGSRCIADCFKQAHFFYDISLSFVDCEVELLFCCTTNFRNANANWFNSDTTFNAKFISVCALPLYLSYSFLFGLPEHLRQERKQR